MYTPVNLAGAVLLIGFILFYLFRHYVRGPIPGIPFDASSARRLLGDLPDVKLLLFMGFLGHHSNAPSQALKWRAETSEMWSLVRQRALDLNSPVFQLFMGGPFGKPWVVITDFRESLDIQSSRQGEFDRSAWLGNVFGPLLPRNHVWVMFSLYNRNLEFPVYEVLQNQGRADQL